MTRARRDDALSDIVGTTMLLAVTVTLLAAAAVTLGATRTADEDALRARIMATGGAGDRNLTIAHAGGDEIDPARLEVVVAAGGSVLARAAMPDDGTPWSLGDSARVPLDAPLAAGSVVDVQVVDRPRSATFAAASFEVPAAPTSAALVGFNVTLVLGNSTGEPAFVPPARFAIRAVVAHAEGRLAVESVQVDLSALGGPAWTPLADDGRSGDAEAGDGTWSGEAYLPTGAKEGVQVVSVLARDAAGREASATATVRVLDGTPPAHFNTALIEVGGHRAFKYPGSGSGDAVTMHLKVRAQSANVTLDGVTYSLKRATLVHDPLGPGGSSERAATRLCSLGRVVAFEWANATIKSYDFGSDDLRYYFRLTWESASGARTFTSNVEASDVYQFFVLRNGDPSPKVVQYNGWPTRFTACSDP